MAPDGILDWCCLLLNALSFSIFSIEHLAGLKIVSESLLSLSEPSSACRKWSGTQPLAGFWICWIISDACQNVPEEDVSTMNHATFMMI